MSKIYNLIPGSLVKDSSVEKKIIELLDSIEFDKWIEVNEEIYSLGFFQQHDEFYVMYLDPRGVVKRLYTTTSDEIVDFMKERINFEYGEGLDLAICTKEMSNAVVCNHDGQVFILKI